MQNCEKWLLMSETMFQLTIRNFRQSTKLLSINHVLLRCTLVGLSIVGPKRNFVNRYLSKLEC